MAGLLGPVWALGWLEWDGRLLVMEIDHGEQHLIERVAAIDIGKAEMVCCVRVPGAGRARAQEVRTYSTMTPNVLEMTDWLTGWGSPGW